MTILRRIYERAYKACNNIDDCLKVYSSRKLWSYVALAFNKVDDDRLKNVGPDRLCAEWILKNGGGVRTTSNPNHLLKDYNSLPPENVRFYIKVVDASDSSIMKIGLQHFKNCNYIDTVIFHNCKHLEEDGLEELTHLTKTLNILQVSGCHNIRDEGLRVIGKLKNLKLLKIFDMIFVKNIHDIQEELQKMLPNCVMEISK